MNRTHGTDRTDIFHITDILIFFLYIISLKFESDLASVPSVLIPEPLENTRLFSGTDTEQIKKEPPPALEHRKRL